MTHGPTGVLLVNLGTPDSPDPLAVRRYLTEFLTDGRVIDLPWLRRQLLVRWIIIPSRYKQSAKAYKKIWTSEGSPLLLYGRRVQAALQKTLGNDFIVEFGMRYQQPSLKGTVQKLMDQGISHLIVVPLFPQYASATTGSVQQRVFELMSAYTVIPKVSVIAHYYNNSKMVDAFCAQAKKRLDDSYDHILFSFHGLPEAQLIKVDQCGHCLKSADCCITMSQKNANCYSAQCHATATAIAQQLQIPKEKYSLCFQSRLGKAPWLRPYAGETIINAAKAGHKKILLFSPSFVCDCLETLYEIGIEYAEEFKMAGGEQLDLVEGLNDHPLWIDALSSLVHSHSRT
ncbi:MAG: ferrochelatase [Parachlamydiaceae bacterium]|nr:ferrochelatase [Parachlamydiaceae bacterium]